MPEYLVTWKIDEEADSAIEAAMRAFITQRDPESLATIFDVTDKATGLTQTIDVDPEN